MAIDHDKLLAAIDAHADSAYGSENDTAIAEHRARLIEAYLGLNSNPAPEGRSQVVDRAVFETIQTMLPSLVRIFAGSADEVVKFTPVGPEDEAAAEQTTQYINHVATQRNQWEQFCADWIHDGLLLGNGYALPYWDDGGSVERETYEGQTDQQLAVLLEDNVQVLQHSQREDKEENEIRAQAFQQAQQQYQQATMMAQQQAQQTGQMPPLPPPPQPPEPAFLHDVVIERLNEDGKLKLCVLPPEHCLVDSGAPDWTLAGAKYFEFRQTKTLAELRAMGLEVPDDVSDSLDPDDSPEDLVRNRFGEEAFGDEGQGALREVTVRTIWVEADAEDDDPRMYYVIAVGRTVLHAEPVSRIHAVSLTPQPLPHRHPGMSVAEMVIDVQNVKTAIKRGGLDNLGLANNGRYAISENVNLDDFLDSRPGGVVRLTDGAKPGEGHIFPLTHPFAFDSIIGSLEYFDQDRQNQAGANRYFSGTDAGAINKTASGTMALQNMSAQRVEHIARMFAPAFETLFSVIHEIISKHQNKGEVIKLRGKWVDVDPTSWKTRRDVKISVGVGAGNKESMLAGLGMMIQMQMALAPAGVARPENIHAALLEQTKLQGFSNPEKFWTDPKANPPQQQMPPQVMVEQMKQKGDQQKFQAQAVLERERAQQEAMQAERDSQLKMEFEQYKAKLDAELEKYKADLQAQTTLQVEQMRLGGQVQIKEAELGQQREMAQFQAQTQDSLEEKKIRLSKEPDPSTLRSVGELGEAINRLHGTLTAPKRVRRGKDGKVEGVDVLGPDGSVIASQGIARGPDGRVVGIG